LEERAARADATAQQILTATAMMARDPGLATAADKHLAGGRGPAAAVDAATEEYCAMFSAAGGYLAERVTDLRDVRDRAVARLLGLEDPGVPELTEPSVIVAHDLAPAETANLRRDLVLATRHRVRRPNEPHSDPGRSVGHSRRRAAAGRGCHRRRNSPGRRRGHW